MRLVLMLSASALAMITAAAQGTDRIPTARLVPTSRLTMPGQVDSNVPLIWELVDGEWQLRALTTWGGAPKLSVGPELARMPPAEPVVVEEHPGHGVWMESIIKDDQGVWYGYYHNELPACGRTDRFVPQIGALKSDDRGRTWRNLGIILEAPADSTACDSTNRYIFGGVGDVSALLDADAQYLYLYFTQYVRQPSAQGIAVARLVWADRDEPRGRVSVWQEDAWIPAREADAADDDPETVAWEYPLGSVLVQPTKPWHDRQSPSDAYWGAALHWNTYVERYVMLVNRARDENFNQDGIYLAFSGTLDDPRAWSPPRKLTTGGGWYGQVAGLDHASGTDKEAGQRARFFVTGRSDHLIEFTR